MVEAIIAGIVSLAFGLYAGKRRARGFSWIKIISEMSVCTWKFIVASAKFIAGPFRRDKPDEVQDGVDK